MLIYMQQYKANKIKGTIEGAETHKNYHHYLNTLNAS